MCLRFLKSVLWDLLCRERCDCSAAWPRVIDETIAYGDDSFFVSGIVQAIFLSEGVFAKLGSKRK